MRAGTVEHASDWTWSGYRAHCGLDESLPWLDTPSLYGFLLGQDAETQQQERRAAQQYAEWMQAGQSVRLWDEGLKQQTYSGDDEFVERRQYAADKARR